MPIAMILTLQPKHTAHRLARTCAIFAMLAIVSACGGLTDVPDPSTIVDPSQVQTQDGAVGLYRGSVSSFARVFAGEPSTSTPTFVQRGYSYALADGFAGDQFSTEKSDNIGEYFMQRTVDPAIGHDLAQPYSDMHTTRLVIDQAIGALRDYGKTIPKSYIGELFALKGYLYIMFGEMYCSGVPFSRAVYGGDVVLGQPESTTEMFEHAIAQFDTAITVATDSARIRQLAYVGKARALVDLARFTDAAAVVTPANVPDNFTYDLTYSAQTFPNYFFISTFTSTFIGGPGSLFEGNQLGVHGLPYSSAGDPSSAQPDPRVAWTGRVNTLPFPSQPYPIPNKFLTGGDPVTLGSGIEARLIQAEADLQQRNVAGWATILNDLRASVGIPALPVDSTTSATDTLRQNVMFRERAFWMYGTGHRLGDLRRLVRQYHRAQTNVFPTGAMPVNQGMGTMYYSNNTNFVPPQAERNNNPYYKGCLNRDP